MSTLQPIAQQTKIVAANNRLGHYNTQAGQITNLH